MDDKRIISMLWQRDEQAIEEFSRVYGRLCLQVAKEITGDKLDAEECFSDTCFAIWNSIPPKRPESLRAYALRICKNFSLNTVKLRSRVKRSAVIVELDECVSENLPDMELNEIGHSIDAFMETLTKTEAVIFIRRYNFSQPVSEIAQKVGLKDNQVSKILQKLRKKLKKYLEKEGVGI